MTQFPKYSQVKAFTSADFYVYTARVQADANCSLQDSGIYVSLVQWRLPGSPAPASLMGRKYRKNKICFKVILVVHFSALLCPNPSPSVGEAASKQKGCMKRLRLEK
jgi:hypothetical protein